VNDRPATHGNGLAELFLCHVGSNTLHQLLGCSCGSLSCCWFCLHDSDGHARKLIETLCTTDLQHTEIALQSCSFAASEAIHYSSFLAAHAVLLLVAGFLCMAAIAAQRSL
jgi:hypothetical protein